nr:hypothetical protein [Tanacetum cinerariifolium]
MLPEMIEDPYVEVALQAPPSPDYIPGPEEPEQAPPSQDYVPGPEHAGDEIVAEDQPYVEDASPIAQSPEYVPESDFEAHPEDDDDEDPEEDLVDYLADGEDDDDDEEESSEDGEDDDMDVEADEEEEHPALADSIDPEEDPIDYLADGGDDGDDEEGSSEDYKDDEDDDMDIEANEEEHPAPADSLPSASHREDKPEVTLPHWKRLDITLGPRYEVGKSSSIAAARPAGGLRVDYGFVAIVDRAIVHDPEREVGYGITNSWDEIVETLQGAPVSTDTELGGYVREFETRVRQDTDEIYMRLDDEQTERQLLAGQLNMLFRDRRNTCHLMETEARMSREAWVRATNASDLVHGEVMSLRTTVLGQMSEIRELQAANRRRHTVISELVRIDHRRSIEILELRTALQGQVTAL